MLPSNLSKRSWPNTMRMNGSCKGTCYRRHFRSPISFDGGKTVHIQDLMCYYTSWNILRRQRTQSWSVLHPGLLYGEYSTNVMETQAVLRRCGEFKLWKRNGRHRSSHCKRVRINSKQRSKPVEIRSSRFQERWLSLHWITFLQMSSSNTGRWSLRVCQRTLVSTSENTQHHPPRTGDN